MPEIEQRAEALGAAKRERVVRRVASDYLHSRGLFDATVATFDAGYGVRISMSAAEACLRPVAAQPDFESLFRKALPFLKLVVIEVGGYQGSLASYVKTRCSQRSSPAFKREGEGNFVSPRVSIRQRRWQVVFGNVTGEQAQLEVIDSAGEVVETVTLSRSGIAHRWVTGSGRYRLRVRAIGRWIVAAGESGA